MDGFNVNSPIGSASDYHKILGIYYSILTDLVVASKRCTIQTLALIWQKDVDTFGLSFCLKEILSELELLVNEGFYDEKTDTRIQIRLICSLGTIHILRKHLLLIGESAEMPLGFQIREGIQ